jgi:hypothetical protein
VAPAELVVLVMLTTAQAEEVPADTLVMVATVRPLREMLEQVGEEEVVAHRVQWLEVVVVG